MPSACRLSQTLGRMGTIQVDFIAKGKRAGTWVMVLVEEGPWHSAEVETKLRHLQERLYGCLDAALDGQLNELYPESAGGLVIVRLDGYDLPQDEVREFFARFSRSALLVPDYADLLRHNTFVSGIAFELNLERLKH
jgi:hypothetical protein